jgi:signal transduction histidine kinase
MMMPETSSPHPAAARLRQFVIVDLCAIASGVLLCLGMYLWLLPSPWILGLAAVVAADGAVIASATRFLSHRQYARTATTICAGTWATALGVTLIAPSTLPIMALTAQMPVILALPYVSRLRLRVFMLLTVGCVLGLGMLARLQDMSGVSVQIPDSFQDIVVIASLPVMAGVILLIVWHNSAALRSMAEAATSANNALRASQHLLADRADQLAASRARLVKATDSERRRIERDLHDGAQQHLVALAINLRLAQRIADKNPAQCGPLLVELAAQLQAGIEEIRRLAHGIYPPLLASGGLAQVIPAAAAKAPVTTNATIDHIGRYSPEIETAVYFCCLEALQNTAKHAGGAATATIKANHDGTDLTVTIADNGCGFDPATTTQGTGLTNMADRVAVVSGSLRIDSHPLEGTRITITIPITGNTINDPHGPTTGAVLVIDDVVCCDICVAHL